MSQHDYSITNSDANTGVTMRAAINAALQALASCNSGATEPATPYAYMWWADTTTGILKQRNAANDGWVNKCSLAGTPIEKALMTAQSILIAISNATPAALTVTEQTVIGRLTGGNIKSLSVAELTTLINAATDALKGTVILATTAESVTGTNTTKVNTPAGGQAKAEDERTRQAENSSEQIQHPIPAAERMLKAAPDGSPAQGSNTDAEVADAVAKRHTQNTDTGTTAASFRSNSGGFGPALLATGLTGNRDYTLPDINTMLAGSVAMAQDSYEIVVY